MKESEEEADRLVVRDVSEVEISKEDLHCIVGYSIGWCRVELSTMGEVE